MLGHALLRYTLSWIAYQLNEGRKPSLLQSISRRDLETCSTDGKLAKNYDRALFNALKPAKKRKVCMYPYL